VKRRRPISMESEGKEENILLSTGKRAGYQLNKKELGRGAKHNVSGNLAKLLGTKKRRRGIH